MRRVGAHDERVAVRRGLGDELRADGAVSARLVIDDELLPKGFGQKLTDLTRDGVGGAACTERHDHLHWLVWICLCADSACHVHQ